MEDLRRLVELIRERNRVEAAIAAVIGYPGEQGAVGEYIASRIFGVTLADTRNREGFDGRFAHGPLQGRTVEIKWFLKRLGIDLKREPPDHYLILTGPKDTGTGTRKQVLPWRLDAVYLFNGPALHEQQRQRGVKLGDASSIRDDQWAAAELYPTPRTTLLTLTDEQRELLRGFAALAEAVT